MSNKNNLHPVFVNRRKGERRKEADMCKDMSVDLYHRKRRKGSDRRSPGKTLADDYYAFLLAQAESVN